MLWAEVEQPIKSNVADLTKPKDLSEKYVEQRKNFLEASKHGGLWFSKNPDQIDLSGTQ